MQDNPSVHRELGQHDAEIDNLKAEVALLRKDVTAVLAILNQTKGSWRTLVLLGSISAALGAGLMELLKFFR